MRSRPASQFARIGIVLVMIVAWFVASDHCAMATVLLPPAASPSVHESCPGHSSQPEKTPAQGELPCCKSLVATAAPVKIALGYDSNSFVFQAYLVADFLSVGRDSDAPSGELDTGPPEVRTFAESVLQRSLLAHAPPVLG